MTDDAHETPASADGLTRNELSRLFSTTERTLRRWEAAGQLEGERDENGTVRYPASQVRRLLLERSDNGSGLAQDGELAAQMFEAFDKGLSPIEVVKRLKHPPAVVRSYHGEWLSMRSDILLSRDHRAELAKHGIRARTAVELVSEVADLSREAVERRGFRYPCTCCGEIILAYPHHEWKQLLQDGALRDWGHTACVDRAAAGR